MLASSTVVPPIVELGRALGWSPLPVTVREARRLARASGLGLGPALDPPPPSDSPYGLPVLTADNLTVMRGRTVALREVSTALRARTVTALMGRNGSGKSTLLWTLQGTLARRAGSVAIQGVDPADLSPARRRRQVGLVPQTAADLLYLETVGEECAAADHGAAPGECRMLLDQLVPGLRPDVHPRDLSEGQRLALALAVVLVTRPPVVMLDEPTRGLDYQAKTALSRILRRLANERHAVLVATHDVEFAALAADEVMVLAEGEVVSSGPARKVLTESPAFAPQVSKILGPGWLRVDEVSQ
jgi:energy-coupling factor transport system ATP-binding protein